MCLCVDTTNAGQDAMYPCVVVAKHGTGHWHCLHSMQSRVYATVGRPSIRPFVPSGRHTVLLQVCCCRPGGQEISVDCCMASGQQQLRRSMACSSKCG